MQFKGDFDGYYQSDNDPWEQSGDGDMKDYYHSSRTRVCQLLPQKAQSLLEIGCGLGFALSHFHEQTNIPCFGMDISTTAVNKARRLFPEFSFDVNDICQLKKNDSSNKHDVIILNQLLWYILDDLDNVFTNIYKLLEENGTLIVCNAFARDQKYGLNIIDGFDGALKKFRDYEHLFNFVHHAHSDEGYRNTDAVFVFIKK
jgi:SAM-dependent methyltransferase